MEGLSAQSFLSSFPSYFQVCEHRAESKALPGCRQGCKDNKARCGFQNMSAKENSQSSTKPHAACLPHPHNQIKGGTSRASAEQRRWLHKQESNPRKRGWDMSVCIADATALVSQAFGCLSIWKKKPSLPKKRGKGSPHALLSPQ